MKCLKNGSTLETVQCKDTGLIGIHVLCDDTKG